MGKKEEVATRQEKEYQYYTKEGIIEIKEIKQKLEQELGIEITEKTVREDLKNLEGQGKIKIITQKQKTEVRKEIVKDLYGDQGITGEKLREETNKRLEERFGIPFSFSMTVIEKDIKELKDNNEVSETAKKQRMEKAELARMEPDLKETERLVKEGKTVDQIAKITGKHKDTIKSYKRILREQKRLTGKEKPKRKATIEKETRMKKVDDIDDGEKTVQQMSEEVNVSRTTIARDKKRLREQKQKRREIVKCGVILKRTKEQIQQEVEKEMRIEVSLETIHDDIIYIENEGIIKKPEDKKLVIPRRREIVKIMYNNDKSREEIFERLQELGFEKTTIQVIIMDITYLGKQGEITVDRYRRKREAKEKKKQELLSKLEEETEEIKTNKQLAEESEISEPTIGRYKKELEKEGNIIVKMPKQKNKEKLVRELKKDKKTGKKRTNTQLAKELNVSVQTIGRYKKELRKEAIEYLVDCKEREKQGNVKEEELPTIKDAVIITETYEDVELYIRLCIRFNRFKGAIEFARTYKDYEYFTEKEKIKIEKIILQCENFYKAILRKKALQMKKDKPEDVRKNEENDDGDEQELA